MMLETIDVVQTTIYHAVDTNGYQITWSANEETKKIFRNIGFFCAFLWFAWVGAQVIIPKKRNELQNGGGGKVWQFALAAFFIVILMDVNMAPTIVNWVIGVLVSIFKMVFPGI